MTHHHGKYVPDLDDVASEGHAARLVEHRARLAVWGLGHIGFSTAEAFAKAGVNVVGYDPDTSRVTTLEALRATRLRVSSDVSTVLARDCLVHMVAVPTERDGEPFAGALVTVIEAIADAVSGGDLAGMRPLLLIESTLTPGTTTEVVIPLLAERGLVIGHQLLLGLAPRRDWFLAEGYGLRVLDRVFAAKDEISATATREVLGLVNDVLHRASGHREGELVKCVENAFRHLNITLANELTLAFPDVDMAEVLRLAGTKWNVGTFHPSFGTGGYCIPLASRYLIRGAEHPEELGLLRRTIHTDDRIRLRVADAARARPPIVVLGIAYKGGIKVDVLSPARAIVQRLRELGVELTVHDPLYDDVELAGLLGSGFTTDDVAEALHRARTVLVVPDHPQFAEPLYVDAINRPREEPVVVIDNHGGLAHVPWAEHVLYRRAGGERWLKILEEARP